jgi:hypothetical protein
MAFVTRIAPHVLGAALLPVLIAYAAPAEAQTTPRPSVRHVAPVARVDLGAPDPRCSDLAYPLWDDGMCVRAKCADDDACEFSKVAVAPRPSSPTRLGEERWRTATLAPKNAAPAVRPTLLAQAKPNAKDARQKVGIPLLAEARTAPPPHARPTGRAGPEHSAAPAKAARAPEPPSLLDRIRAALERLWRWIQGLGEAFAPTKRTGSAKGVL